MKFVTLGDLRIWLNRLTLENEYTLVAPCDVDGHVLYRPIASGDEVLLDYQRPELSPKDCLLPATEVMLQIEKRGDEVVQKELLSDRTQVLFGVRPCDAHGFAVMDALFLGQDPPDLYYRHHRERTVLVGLACPQMWEACFCTSLGGAPDDPTHLDLLLREVDGGYAVEVVTERGSALLDGLTVQEWEGELPPPVTRAETVPILSPQEWRSLFEEERIWKRHGERCLSCRLCAYVCPTCRCFDVTDRVVEERAGVTRIERIRVWDACTSTNYRRAAGGHNPRPTKPGRLRNRFYCKFCYYPEDFGPVGCVGCGRCIVSCPVDVDIGEVLRDVAEATLPPACGGTFR